MLPLESRGLLWRQTPAFGAGGGRFKSCRDYMEPIVVVSCHLIADFPFQTDSMAQHKFGGGPEHLAHVGVHLLLYSLVLIPLYQLPGLLTAMFVAGWHGVIDYRRWVEPKENFEDYPIWVDQSLHIASIAAAMVMF